jgi:replicative DNA helicase
VVVISSLNRASYTKSITMEAFKESGAIEYGTDVLIGLQIRNRFIYKTGNGVSTKTESQYHQEAAEHYERETSKDIREIELKVIKNRNGIKGKVNLEYKTAVNYIREADDQ